MNLKAILLPLILPTLVVILGGCGGDGETTDTTTQLPVATPTTYPTFTPDPTYTPQISPANLKSISSAGSYDLPITPMCSNQVAYSTSEPAPAPTPNGEVTQETKHESTLPPHVGGAVKRLAFDLAVPEANFILIALEPIDWPDTSLGCPKPGYMYAQVITSGYKVTFELGRMSYVVRTDKDGSNTARCDVTPPTPTP